MIFNESSHGWTGEISVRYFERINVALWRVIIIISDVKHIGPVIMYKRCSV